MSLHNCAIPIVYILYYLCIELGEKVDFCDDDDDWKCDLKTRYYGKSMKNQSVNKTEMITEMNITSVQYENNC